MGSTAPNIGKNVKSDAAEDFYLSGAISGTTDLDPSPAVANFSSSSVTDFDGFLAKYNSTGV
jgi:hypothetical protein